MTAQQTYAVGINMGANYTGVCTISGNEETGIDAEGIQSCVIIIPSNGDGFTSLMRNRTLVRHSLRTRTRFCLVRRLMHLICDHFLADQSIDEIERRRMHDALSTLLRRRGHTFSVSDLDSLFTTLNPDVFISHPSVAELIRCLNSHPFFSVYFKLENNKPSSVPALPESPVTVKDFQLHVKDMLSSCPDADPEAYAQGYAIILEAAQSTQDLVNRGRQKSRGEYLSGLVTAIESNGSLAPLVQAVAGADSLAALVGNINNLNLRELRQYFKSAREARTSTLSTAILLDAVRSAYHRFASGIYQDGRTSPVQELMQWLEDANPANILRKLSTLAPVKTIPPYDHVGNRLARYDATLLLSPTLLDRNFPQWMVWADRLLKAESDLDGDLNEILKHTDRKSRRFHNKENLDKYRLSYVLQRVLDRTNAADPYAIRALTTTARRSLSRQRERLAQTLGAQHVEAFLEFAHAYYDELGTIQKGLFLIEESKLLERADIHPPRIEKVIPFLVADVLRCRLQQAQTLLDEAWHLPLPSDARSTVKSACRLIEQARKDDGLTFGRVYRTAVARRGQSLKPEPGDRTYLHIDELTHEVADVIATALGLSDEQASAFDNPFSLAQLYCLIETKRYGHSAVTIAARLENTWRRQSITVLQNGEEVTAQMCRPLPVDNVHPLDGQLSRILDRQAHEVVKLVSSRILSDPNAENSNIHIPLLIEQNTFAFDLSLSSLKMLQDARAAKRLRQEEARWQTRDDRIREGNRIDDMWLSPFTGKRFTRGEYAQIRKPEIDAGVLGRAWDAEPNLLWVAAGESALMSNSRMLEDLHPDYLHHIFGTTSTNEIRTRIEARVETLAKNRGLLLFNELVTEDQACIRHALFLPTNSPAHQAVVSELLSSQRQIINGTQRWFVRQIKRKLLKALGPWCRKKGNALSIDAYYIHPASVARIRRLLGEQNSALQKSGRSGIMSSAIDALCVCSSGWQNVTRHFGFADSLRRLDHLQTYLPATCDLIRVQAKAPGEPAGSRGTPVAPYSKRIFKMTNYGENFLPLFTRNGRLFIGHPNTDCVDVKGDHPENLLVLLAPCLNQTVEPLSSNTVYTVNKAKAFEFLSSMAHEETDEAELYDRGAMLEALHYFTLRPALPSWLLNTAQTRFMDRDSLLADIERGTTVKVALRSAKRNEFSASGKVSLPVRHEWNRLIEHEALAPLLGLPATAELLRNVLTQIKPPSSKPNRWSCSLPMVVAPAGAPVRIRRKNLRGEILFQTQTVNSLTCGFEVENNAVQWDRPVIHDYLLQPALTPKGARKRSPDQAVMPLNTWRCVTSEPVALYISPGSSTRRRVMLMGDFEILKPWIQSINPNFVLKDCWSIPAAIAFKEGDNDIRTIAENCFGVTVAKLIDKPKGRVLFHKVGKQIVCSFNPASSTVAMREAFDKGSPV